ncbi:polysaccharide deacetylase [Hoeflea olei]|uniref:Polysaccharide deacetylase n=1 Tax=Hoeflea olei TaxID=1480615 RepID=A0A1C1YQ41_9HYPH|nr:polysaccharide deacetylase [Hoeflea olei]
MAKALPALVLGGLAVTAAIPAAQAESRPAQLVIVSFDGAHDNVMWERSLKMAEKTGAHFTYFLSCTFLMSKAERKGYTAPGKSAGASNIGFAPDHADVENRLNHIWTAYRAGHEIGSHGCGHFDGGAWTKAQWSQEFDQFDAALRTAWTTIGQKDKEPDGWQEMAENSVKGFRAPYLSSGEGLFAALAEHGFAYDASTVSRGPAVPDTKRKPARFALPLIPEGPHERRVIAMDYNLFVRHSKAEETPEHKAEFEERSLTAFEAAFREQYDGARIPLQLGFHFVPMNGGAYWDALETLLTDVCGKPDVECVTYSEALSQLKTASRSAT